MIVTILLAIFLLVLAVVFFLWLVRSMMSVSCPQCKADHDTEEIIIPVVPGWRWFCPTCNGVFPHQEIAKQNQEPGSKDEE